MYTIRGARHQCANRNGNIMINWTNAELERFLAEDPGGPMVMLNLLRFRPDGGRESYMTYVGQLGSIGARYSLEIVYAGDGGRPLVGETG